MDNLPPYYSLEEQETPQPKHAPPPKTGYPPQPTPGYQPQQQGYPPQGQGYVQQPFGYSSQSTNNATVVVQNQPQPQVVTGVIPVVNDHMGLSIFACLCCFWPIGILAVIKSSEVRNRYTAGDYAGALASAKTARNLSIASIISGVIILLVCIIILIIVITL